MSNNSNDIIRERAKEASEECTNSMLGAQLDKAIAEDDLELMQALTTSAERHLLFIETVQTGDIY